MNFLSTGESPNVLMIVVTVIMVVLLIGFLVVPMFTNKKRAKEANELHNSLKPGDIIKTVGGIIGTIVEVRQVSPTDKEMVIETGVGENKSTMTFDIQALYQVISRASGTVTADGSKPEGAPEGKSFAVVGAAPVAGEVPATAEEPVAPAEETAAAEEPAPQAEPEAEEAAVAEPAVENKAPVEESAPAEETAVAEEPAPQAEPEKKTKSAPKSNSGKKGGKSKK